jgi:hypothetical protein
MNQTNTLMIAISMALGVILVAGLIAIPTIEQQQAARADKGGVPNSHASRNAQGRKVQEEKWCIKYNNNVQTEPTTRCFLKAESCSKFESVLTRSKLWNVLESCRQVS